MRTIYRVFTILLLLALATGYASAQWLDDPEEHEENETAGREKFYEWFYHARTFGLGYIPENAYLKAIQDKVALAAKYGSKNGTLSVPNSTLATTVNWKNIGPFNINSSFGGPHGGRINTIAVDPTNTDVAYFGAANGGIWKTTNAGKSWRPTSDQAASLAMGALAIDPQRPSTLYAGTGEYAQGFGAFFGAGILRSTDGGTTWKPIGLANVGAFSKIIVNPKNSNVIYAAGAGSGSGLYFTIDGGTTWKRTDPSLPPGAVTDMDLVVKGGNDILYAAMPSHGIYKSDDGGKLWQLVHEYSQMRRLHVVADPNNSDDVIDMSISYSGGFEGLSRSLDGGATWDNISGDFASNDPFGVAGTFQGWYDAYLTRDPTDPDHFLLGGISVWETRDGGAGWENTGKSYQGGIHPDQHCATFALKEGANGLYVGCDGGIAYSKDGGATFEIYDDSTAITQAYGMAIDQTTDDITYIGTQDNGTLRGSSISSWDDIAGGDGGTLVVDSKNSDKVYFIRPTAWAVSLYTSGGEQDFSNGLNSADSTGWIKPIVQDEKNHIIYTGSQNLYVLTDGATKWTRRSTKLAYGGYISAIGPAGDGKSLMVGTTDGRLWTSVNNGLNFVASTGLPGRAVNDLVVSPAGQSIFYAALSGFGGGHVFKTTDFGVTWSNISGLLPDISANKIVIDPEHPTHLYLATDVGIFYSPNDGVDWTPYGTGFPNVAAFDMGMHKTKKVIRAATHGRSVWEAPMEDIPSGITSPTLTSIWHSGEPAVIGWYGVPGNPVKVEISLDDAKTWITVSDTVADVTRINFEAVPYPITEEALIKVTSGSEILLSQHFKIRQRAAGSSLKVISEQPLYMYDLAYDKHENVLWVTNFSTTTTVDRKIYKLNPDNGQMLGSITAGGGGNFTGIKYDPTSQTLYLNNTPPTGTPRTFEIDKTGKVIRSFIPAGNIAYATGIYVLDDTLFVADRNNNVIHRVSKADPSLLYSSIELERHAAFGPRCLTIKQKTGDLLHTWTDFQGTDANASLYDSYILKLSRDIGLELASWFVQEGGNNGTNVRGLEYDPRSDGKEVWVTVLNSGNSAKVMKVTLVDGPATRSVGTDKVNDHSISAYPNPVQDKTTLRYALDRSSETRIMVRDILGRETFTASYGVESAGEHGHQLQLEHLPAGGYTVSLYSGTSLLGTTSIVVY